jgi:hypothetical protein
MAAYLEVPVARAQVFNEKEQSPIAYIIDVRPGDFSLHSHDPFLSPER